jgi:AcrR family transcriptional regulator
MFIHLRGGDGVEQGGKREAVIQAALELVGEHGFHGAPMAAIAERAGVAAGTIYRFFDSKDTLIKQIHGDVEAGILAAATEGYPADASARERFLHVGRRVVGYFVASPMQFRFLEQFHNSPYGVACRREKVFGTKGRNVIGELLVEAGEQRIIKDLPPAVLMALIFGPLVAICRDHILKFITLDDALIERTVEACWDAIRRWPDAAAG